MMTFPEACRAILADTRSRGANLAFAQSYARAGLDSYHSEQRDAVRVQALYILSNLFGWRAPEAKAVRETMRRVVEVK